MRMKPLQNPFLNFLVILVWVTSHHIKAQPTSKEFKPFQEIPFDADEIRISLYVPLSNVWPYLSPEVLPGGAISKFKHIFQNTPAFQAINQPQLSPVPLKVLEEIQKGTIRAYISSYSKEKAGEEYIPLTAQNFREYLPAIKKKMKDSYSEKSSPTDSFNHYVSQFMEVTMRLEVKVGEFIFTPIGLTLWLADPIAPGFQVCHINLDQEYFLQNNQNWESIMSILELMEYEYMVADAYYREGDEIVQIPIESEPRSVIAKYILLSGEDELLKWWKMLK